MEIPEISLEMVAGLLRPPACRVRFPGKFPETCFAQTPQISKRISRNLRQGQAAFDRGSGMLPHLRGAPTRIPGFPGGQGGGDPRQMN